MILLWLVEFVCGLVISHKDVTDIILKWMLCVARCVPKYTITQFVTSITTELILSRSGCCVQ